MSLSFINYPIAIEKVGNPLHLPVYFTTPQELGAGTSMATSLLRAGYLLSVINGEHGLLNFFIRRSQRRMLKDYNTFKLLSADIIKWASSFSHSAVHMDKSSYAEMYAPKARVNDYKNFSPGQLLLFSVPLNSDGTKASEKQLDKIAMNALYDVNEKTPYSVRELFYFYCYSWHFQKLFLGRKFAQVFHDKKKDVCSGRYAYWCISSGVWSKDRIVPEGAYPAFLVLESTLTKPLFLVQLISEAVQKELFSVPVIS